MLGIHEDRQGVCQDVVKHQVWKPQTREIKRVGEVESSNERR